MTNESSTATGSSRKASSVKQSNWFDVDRAGLEKILRRKGVEFAVFELIQNAWDEKGVTRVDVTLTPANKRGCAMLKVEDNSAEGFSDLRHAYTLFAESKKKSNAQQRGRFNVGEKLVLSLCEWALITTTKGRVVFDHQGRNESKIGAREFGTTFEALIHMSKDEIAQCEQAVKRLIVPTDIETTFNGVTLHWRKPAHTLEATLTTEVADADGYLRRSNRRTTVHCYEPLDGETAMIYEMGIPVCEHDCAFHCDVLQKVPLTIDRENVVGRFKTLLHTEVFNATHEALETEHMNREFAQVAIESGNATPEAVQDWATKRFGEKRVSYDMSDPEANNKATANGYTVITGGAMSGAAWQAVKSAEAIAPAGQLFPTHSENFVAYQKADETDNMKAVRSYADTLAMLLLGCSITVEFGEQKSNEAACWGHRRLQFNVHNLGKQWFNLKTNRLAIDDLIIHEFGHHYSGNHLSEQYYHALSKLAAQAMQLGREGRLP